MNLSRRRFLKSSLAAPLAATLGGTGLELWGTPLPTAGSVTFQNPDIIRYDSQCFTINGQDTILHSGSFHYCRCPQELWSDRLLKLKRAGFNTVMTYIIWNYHEPVEGQCDLSSLEAYIQLVKEMGLWLIARPGPYACAEWDDGGFPHWVAAMRFPLRSDNPASIKTSQHWFSEVLPVIRRHQITHGGPIITMQIENEYDYWQGVSDAQKRAYITALAEMAWNAGIDVPLFTCWTRQARENNYPAMSQIMDSCNFYPRWNIFPSVPDRLQQLRRQEPDSPLQVTELQGGWFSQFGGKLSVDQDGINAAQLNLLTKTVLEQGVTSYNYYMGFGGTNFDWAAKNITTTYDYAAPIREPGGLWEKYYAARGICEFLNLHGNVLSRAEEVTNGCSSANAAVSVSMRKNGRSAVVFVRENANAEQTYKMTFPDPASPTHRAIQVPREGVLTLGPRAMKMIPVQVPIRGGTLRYSTAEVMAHGANLGHDFLIVYDDPGRVAEIALATDREPRVEGDAIYQYWDRDYESLVLGVRVENSEKILYINHRLLLVVAPRERALRTWTPRFSARPVPGVDERKPPSMDVPFITDAALLADHGAEKSRVWAALDLRPGDHKLTVILPPLPSQCTVDGEEHEFQYQRRWRTAQVGITTPPVPANAVDVSEVRYWVERFDPNMGQWEATELKSLDETGAVPYGYVKYRAEFSSSSEGDKLFIDSSAEDAKKVFVNGRLVRELSNSLTEAEAPIAKNLKPAGPNVIEISYEAFGTPNFGKKLGELKGIKTAEIGTHAASAKAIEGWKLQRYPAPARAHGLNPDFSIAAWKSRTLTPGGTLGHLVPCNLPAFTWCRAEFDLEKPAEEWFAPWKLTFEAACDALFYLNDKFVGRYVTVGPQKDFYLPEPFLNFGGKNALTIVLAYTDDPAAIRALRVSPYGEFAVRRTRIEFEW
jgi:hypothetical protein